MATRAWITKGASWSGLKDAPGSLSFSTGSMIRLNSRMRVVMEIKIKVRAADITEEGTNGCITTSIRVRSTLYIYKIPVLCV